MNLQSAPATRSAFDRLLLPENYPVYPLPEMVKFNRPMVYGLVFPEREIFYIGQTANPRVRFYRYAQRMSERDRNNLHVIRRITQAKDGLRVAVLKLPDPTRLREIERDLIIRYAPQLTNIQHNAYKSPGNCCGIVLKTDTLGACSVCDGPRDLDGRFCSPCIQVLTAAA